MYFQKLETDRNAKINSDKAHKALARERLSGMKHRRQEECAPNRKKAAVLAARVKDWESTISTMKGNTAGFRKPGSMQ